MVLFVVVMVMPLWSERELKQKIDAAVRARDYPLLEELSQEAKGRPGLATVRKTIKKHMKRLADELKIEADRARERELESNSAKAAAVDKPLRPSMPKIFLDNPVRRW